MPIRLSIQQLIATQPKKLRDTLTEIDQEWQAEGQLHLMFQDEARFGRISDTRRYCGAPSLCARYARQ